MKTIIKQGLLWSMLLWAMPTAANYKIHGRVNLGNEWQPKIFLAIIEELSDYYRASPELIVNAGIIQSDGSFTLEGDELPAEDRFYRLYLMKEQNTEFDACLYVGGDDHNFIHVILNNDSQLKVTADSTYYAPFGNYTIEGNTENHLMRELSRMVYPSFYFYQIRFPTELRLSEEKLFSDLTRFADTCSSTIVALAAVSNTDMERYYKNNENFYKSFGDRLSYEIEDDVYTRNYLRKLQFYAGVTSYIPNWVWVVMALQGLIILALALVNVRMHWQSKHTGPGSSEENQEPQPAEVLTAKELEILQMIAEGKSNKEIANLLFIEISTVKTHINKIYTKLNVKSRKEAINAAKAQL